MQIRAEDVLFLNVMIARAGGGVEAVGPARLRIGRLTRAVRMEAENINEQLRACARSHAELDANGKPLTISTPSGETFVIKDTDANVKEQKTIREASIELVCEPLPITDLDKVTNSALIDAFAPFLAET